MARDYARQQRPAGKQARQAGSGGHVPGWVWAVGGLSVGLGIAAIVFIAVRPVAAPEPAAPEAPADSAAATIPELPPPSEPRYKFYDLLPKFEVKPNTETYKVEPGDRATELSGRFLIQAGSFSRQADAERRKASIALLGIESKIEKVTLGDQRVRYRVQIGPDNDYERVREIMHRLAENEIDSFAARVGG